MLISNLKLTLSLELQSERIQLQLFGAENCVQWIQVHESLSTVVLSIKG